MGSIQCRGVGKSYCKATPLTQVENPGAADVAVVALQHQAVRRQLLEESGGTIAGLTERLRREQADSGRPLYDPADNNLMHRSGDGERSSRGESTATAR